MSSRDQRDRDDELLGPPPGMLSMPDQDTELQVILDQVTGGGLYPHWDNRPDRHATDSRCVVYHGTSRCWRDEEWKAWIGCVHEHIASSGVCGFHMIEIETARFGWRCSLCWDATGQVVLARYISKEPA
jgi:hypothetical protein